MIHEFQNAPRWVVYYAMGPQAFEKLFMVARSPGFVTCSMHGIRCLRSEYMPPRMIAGFDDRGDIVEQFELEDI